MTDCLHADHDEADCPATHDEDVDCEYGERCQRLMEKLMEEDPKPTRWWGIYGSYRKAAHDILTLVEQPTCDLACADCGRHREAEENLANQI